MPRPYRLLGNEWLAIDAATPLLSRARELRRDWERFLGDGEAGAVRAPIALSWKRSRDAGVDPFRAPAAATVGDPDEVAARWEVHPLAAAAPLILECLGPVVDEAEDLIVVSDADGTLLWIQGNARARLRAADAMNFAEGACWNEAGAGTNAIGIALSAAHPIQVFGAEHFNEAVQVLTCSAAPVHDPDTGELLGVINLTGPLRTAHPLSYTGVLATARAVESFLRYTMQERDFRLRSRYAELIAKEERRALVTPTGRVLTDEPEEWLVGGRLVLPPGGGEVVLPSGVHAFAEPVGHEEAYIVRNVESSSEWSPPLRGKLRLLGRDRAVLELEGRTVTLSRRLAEVLALLASRPGGITSEELAADLYGDAGQPSAARVEVYRLRKVLGGAIETDPYRLALHVESDIARIRGLLDRGAIREAAARYEGPLLPHSEAPGIVRDRDALEAWLRNAVMTADDAEALWHWVQSPSGSDDLPAWKRLLALLDFSDPRRSLAASQVGALRLAYAS
jgi:hypothetical protein